jgi:hypothetical protein
MMIIYYATLLLLPTYSHFFSIVGAAVVTLCCGEACERALQWEISWLVYKREFLIYFCWEATKHFDAPVLSGGGSMEKPRVV